jgi:predicted outer membrane repeat protein
MRSPTSILLFLTALCLTTAPARATTWHILPDGSGDWPTIQAAMDTAAVGDTVLLGCGTFMEHEVSVATGVVLRSEAGVPTCATIDGQGLGHILVCDHVTQVLIEGITFTGGHATDSVWPHWGGGALNIRYAEVNIRDCVFRENDAVSGGGAIKFSGVAGEISDCVFEQNSVPSVGEGGAVYVSDECDLLFNRCSFAGGEAFRAGAVYLAGPSVFVSCLFRGNTAADRGGAIESSGEGAPQFEDCTFSDNAAYAGAGVLYCINYGTAALTNCTISDNSSQYGAAGIECWNASATVDHTILSFSLHGTSVYCNNGDLTLTCSDVYGNAGGDWVDCIASQADVSGNFSSDPLFCDRPGRDYTLDAASPCLDAPGCGLVGAWGEGCGGQTGTESTSWGAIKRVFH